MSVFLHTDRISVSSREGPPFFLWFLPVIMFCWHCSSLFNKALSEGQWKADRETFST